MCGPAELPLRRRVAGSALSAVWTNSHDNVCWSKGGVLPVWSRRATLEVVCGGVYNVRGAHALI